MSRVVPWRKPSCSTSSRGWLPPGPGTRSSTRKGTGTSWAATGVAARARAAVSDAAERSRIGWDMVGAPFARGRVVMRGSSAPEDLRPARPPTGPFFSSARLRVSRPGATSDVPGLPYRLLEQRGQAELLCDLARLLERQSRAATLRTPTRSRHCRSEAPAPERSHVSFLRTIAVGDVTHTGRVPSLSRCAKVGMVAAAGSPGEPRHPSRSFGRPRAPPRRRVARISPTAAPLPRAIADLRSCPSPQNSSGGPRAVWTTGPSAGKPRHSRIARTTDPSVMSASTSRRPPQR